MGRNRRQRAVVLGVAGVAALIALAATIPARRQATLIQRDIDQTTRALVREQVDSAAVRRLAERVDELEAQLAGVDRVVPDSVELASLFGDLSGFLGAEGVAGGAIEQGNARQEAAYTIIPVVMTFKGDFPAVFEVVRQIESLHRIVRINRLDIAAQGRATGPDQMHQVSIQLDTFASAAEGAGS